MKAKDLKTGTAYYYKPNNYASPYMAFVLSTETYERYYDQSRGRYSIVKRDKRTSAYADSAIGVPIIKISGRGLMGAYKTTAVDELIKVLGSITLHEMEAAQWNLDNIPRLQVALQANGSRIGVEIAAVQLRTLVGEYEAYIAEQEAQRVRKNQIEQERTTKRQGYSQRWKAAYEQVRELTGSTWPYWVSTEEDASNNVKIDDLEALIALALKGAEK